ncbi:hypothetical protein [Clostridium estertheticum]|uniref:hypothetical protein n=1 Tax=Clostridium estertheticum TaxID=238834 RepID=UPI001C0C7647|nr:hypothetical protein [Clostridium estertheticum]MBU3073864.1 hypothetical protein [Clostridium estertheticum]MBU3163959.1 hypothetical protein [Clostridium estertheticum]
MDVDYSKIRQYKDRIRIFFIIYFFSENYCGIEHHKCCRVLHTELKIQKLDFLLRNPDYLAYELIELCKTKNIDKLEIKSIVKEIFNQKEPEIRRLEMEKFFFGAYEDIDQVIAFLVTVGFIEHVSVRDNQMRSIKKSYYITKEADIKMQDNLRNMEVLSWYVKRCKLIHKYFGDYSGTALKVLQYEIDEYKNTSYREYINDIQEQVKQNYFEEFGEKL